MNEKEQMESRTPAEAYGVKQPVDMMDKPDGLPTSPQAQQQQQDVINKDLELDQTSEDTLTALPTCPTMWDQLTDPRFYSVSFGRQTRQQ